MPSAQRSITINRPIADVFSYIADGENGQDGYRVNLGCVEGLDTLALDVKIIDGKSLPLAPSS